ncbi:hypothetical protein K491DRAFT_698687 [Lophiostoma macrostomum CBS 122681]|uniref:Uncharacterized protein n=1 Tax=Lophiostoma macrostomum CBS 122681 TaxID=1314788 RepID=A0A6A6SRF6_9PLEO|nr:hypothetical protein K491DRAFT_698687 [Lophiostoma macrostomum CBS 122681]
MAPRGRPSIVSADVGGNFPDSSPDPLSASVNNAKLKKTTRATKTPLASSSPSKHNRRPSVSEPKLEFSSPAKSMVMNTGRPGGASPWRIKVTVEAEPGSGSDENGASPIVRHVTRTTTSTIPLKDSDTSSPVKRTRGRQQRSDATAGGKQKRSATPKRSKTPVRRPSQPRARKSSVAPSDASMADSSTDAAPKKRRGRPRKNPVPETTEEDVRPEPERDSSETGSIIHVLASDPTPTMDAAPQELSSHTSRDMDPKATLSPQQADFSEPFLPDTSVEPSAKKFKRRPRVTLEFKDHAVQTPPRSDLSKKLRDRKGTPHAKIVAPVPEISDESSAIGTPSDTDEEAPEQTIIADAGMSLDGHETHEETVYALDEGDTRMPDDTTILESENFSMVSVDSLPSGGGLSSPPSTQSNLDLIARTMGSVLSQSRLKVPLMPTHASRSSPRQARSSPRPLGHASSAANITSSPPVPIRREQTPVMDHRSPSNPPALQPALLSPSKAETPKIGRVVRAGVALQGVLDPDRITPTGQSKEQALDEQRARLDDLFRGFSEGTRRELQAGLRLGEQLARQTQETRASRQPSPALSSPIKPAVSSSQAEDIFCPRSKHQTSRLLTPEEQDEYTLPVPPAPNANAGVQYPTLAVDYADTQLVSPARSDDEMSWRVDTPPVKAESSQAPKKELTYAKQKEQAPSRMAELSAKEINKEDHSILLDDGQCLVPEISFVGRNQPQVDYPDIWQEEASRSTVEDALPQSKSTQSPQLQELFANNGPIKPPRGKLPRTWRRKSSSDFNYSDEADPEPEQEPSSSSAEGSDEMPSRVLDKGKGRLMTPPSEESEESEEASPVVVITNKGKGKLVASIIPEELYEDEEEEDYSDESDDTGMFFQANLPSVFNKKRSRELRMQKSEKLDLSLLLDSGDSLVPEISPAPIRNPPSSARSRRTPAGVRTSPVKAPLGVTPGRESDSRARGSEPVEHSALLDDEQCVTPDFSSPTRIHNDRRNPFKNTPPQFAAFQASPVRSSPLRQELRASDSEDSYQGPRADESTLPVAQSSPFQTIVEESAVSTASDERQILQEMEGRTDPSIRNLREEADAHAEAYSTQLRSLHEIEEVTEPSRTMRSTTNILPSSPPPATDESPLKRKREYAPLFGDSHATFSSANLKPNHQPQGRRRKPREEPRVAIAPQPTETPQPQPASSSLFSRLTTSLWGALGTSTAPPMHPVTQQFDRLPSVEPWTQTHYKTLDKLYQMHKKSPTLFAPSSSSLPPGSSNSNNALLTHFLESTAQPFVGANYHAWGYQAKMTDSLVVLAAVFAQLCTLKDGAEYEKLAGKSIVLGDCNPGVAGTRIEGKEVVKRLATVMMGEALRKDEKIGARIPRDTGLWVTWPGWDHDEMEEVL